MKKDLEKKSSSSKIFKIRHYPIWLICNSVFFLAPQVEAQILKKLQQVVTEALEIPEITVSRPCMPAAASNENFIFSDDFESGSFAGNMWAARPGESGVVKVTDRLQDVKNLSYTGDYALIIGREGDTRYGGTDHEQTISAADLCLNLRGQEEALLRFYIRDQVDETTPNDAILLSNDGGNNFHQALRLQPYNWPNGIYGAISFDIAAAARQLGLSLSEKMVVRFQQGGVADFAGRSHGDRDGFFIDDIVVMGVPTYVRPPFKEGFESGELGPMWRAADPFRKGETALELQAQWGFVEPVQRIADVPPVPRTGDYALAMGRPSGGHGREPSVNALDLHLDLSGKEEANLQFYLRHEGETDDEADGIFFSDDGGLHFRKALELDLQKRKNGEYGEVTLDLAKTASLLGMKLTNKFIIRIQQAGFSDFAPLGYRQHGFLIDDLTVQTSLSPNEEVVAYIDAKMLEWQKKGKYEKTEDYEERLNKGKAAARDSLTQVALQNLTESRVDWKTARTKYDADKEVFTITIDNLEPFVLKVPIGEAEDFDQNLANLEYEKPVYSIGSGDLFKVEYVEITNPVNGRKYILNSDQ